MGTTGNMKKEGGYLRSADLYSLWFATIGSGYVLSEGTGRCEPEKMGPIEITIDEGKVTFGLPIVHEFNGAVMEVDLGDPPRYDLIYLEYDTEEEDVVAKIKKGDEDDPEGPKVPEIPFMPERRVVPIALVWFEEYDVEITECFDCRTVLDEEHSHTAGDGLELDRDTVKMDVKADEKTVTVENDQVEVSGSAKFNVAFGEGLEYYDSTGDGEADTLRIDAGIGLDLDENEKLIMDPKEVMGKGLTVEDGDIAVSPGNGLDIVAGRLTVDDGRGIILRGETPDRQIDIYHQPDGKLDFDTGELYVKVDELTGEGIEESGGDLKIKAGDGLKLGSYGLEVDLGRGLGGEWNEVLIEIRDNGGLTFTDGTMHLDLDSLEGSGIKVEEGELNFQDGAGLNAGIDSVQLDHGKGTEIDGGVLSANVGRGLGLDPTYDRIRVEPGEVLGDGLKEKYGMIKAAVGDGLEITDTGIYMDYGHGLELNSDGELRVNTHEFVGEGLEKISHGDGKAMKLPIKEFFELELEEEFTLYQGSTKEFKIEDKGYPILVTVNSVEEEEDNQLQNEIEWYLSESDESGKCRVWVEELGDVDDDILVLLRCYHVKWNDWM